MNNKFKPLFIEEYDELGRLIHTKRHDGYEEWYQYNKKNTYYRNSNGIIINKFNNNGINITTYGNEGLEH